MNTGTCSLRHNFSFSYIFWDIWPNSSWVLPPPTPKGIGNPGSATETSYDCFNFTLEFLQYWISSTASSATYYHCISTFYIFICSLWITGWIFRHLYAWLCAMTLEVIWYCYTCFTPRQYYPMYLLPSESEFSEFILKRFYSSMLKKKTEQLNLKKK